jgi:hypothetical protein
MPRTPILAALLGMLFAVTTPSPAQAPPQDAIVPTDAEVRELERQIGSLQQQLDSLKTAPNTAASQRLMEQNWQGMQNYIGRMHDRWDIGYPWMAGRPWSMCGPGMMVSGRTSWPAPQGMTPEQYGEQMNSLARRMQEQMRRIARTTDPQERQRLMQEHWESMYRDMQATRGMGWMWEDGPMMGRGTMHGGMMQRGMGSGVSPPGANVLPDAESPGAKLVATYCVQCHTAPRPALHTADEWSGVTQRMYTHMTGGWRGIRTPAVEEMKTIVEYMRKYARR